MRQKLVFPLLATCLFSACGILERSPESGYSGNQSHQVITKTDSPERTKEIPIETKTRLKQLENSISTRRELEQYSRALPYLRNDDEKIQFLSLEDYEARQKWMRDTDFNGRTQSAQENYKEIVESQDIGLGMTQALVKKSWGEPELVEYSGNPQFRNERWRYKKYVSTPDGFRAEKKTVYFEGGRVAGWESE